MKMFKSATPSSLMLFLWVLLVTVGVLLLAPLLLKVDKEVVSTYYSTPVTMLVGAVCAILGNLFNNNNQIKNEDNKRKPTKEEDSD